jgi:hypothetical protein
VQMTGPSGIYPILQTVMYNNPRALAYNPARQMLYIADQTHRYPFAHAQRVLLVA